MIQRVIRERLQAAGCGEWSRTTHWADEPLESSFWSSLSMPGLLSLLGQGRVLVLRRANTLTVKVWSDLEPLLRKARPDLWTFFCLEGEWKGRTPAVPVAAAKQPFFSAARKRQWVWQSPGMTPRTLRSELTAWAKRRDIGFAPDVEEALAGLLPLDGARFSNELQKLELALGDRRQVTAADLKLFADAPGLDNFAFLRKALRSSADLDVWRTVLLDQESAGPGMLMPVLGLLQRETRILWLLLSNEDDLVLLPAQIKSEKRRLAGKLGEQGVARIIDLVFQAELDLKSGRKQADQVLEFLVSSLASATGARV